MIRVGLSWACYWAGDLWSRIAVNRWPRGRWGWPYVIYNRLMCWADDLQGNDPRGPWGSVNPDMRPGNEL